MKSKFEHDTDRKITNKKIDEYVSTRLRQTEDNLNTRRQRLCDLLAHEKEKYAQELLAAQETREEREAKMKQKVEILRAQREREHKAFVAHKLQQQWHNNCDDLRGAHSQVAMREALKVRNTQMEELKEKANMLQEERIRDAQLWEEDRQRKIAREEADNMDRIRRNKEMVDGLKIQTDAYKKNRATKEKLKKEKAKLVKEYMLNQQKEEAEQASKHVEQQQCRRKELDEMTAQKRARLIQEREQELQSDLEMLEAVVSDMEMAEGSAAERKERLRKESMLYQQYVADMACWRRQQQKELDQILAKETDMAFQAKLMAADKQTAQRQNLMKEVLRIRKEQIQAKLAENAKEMELNAKEAEEMQKDIAAYKAQESTITARNQTTKNQYKEDLDGQMQFQRQNAEKDRDLLEYEYEQAKKNEEEYQRCLKSELARMLVTP